VTSDVGPAVLAFIIAGFLAVLKLLTEAPYKHTFFLLLPKGRCWSLYIYGIIYGIIAACLTLILTTLIAKQILRIEGLGLENKVVRALYVGFFTEAFLDFSLFSIGEQRFGLATIVQAFEPTLKTNIVLDEDHWTKVYIKDRVARYPDIEDVRKCIIADIPVSLPEQEKAAFELDVSKADRTSPAMRLALRQLGRRSFERIFPL